VVFGKPEVLEIAKTIRPEFALEIRGIVNERNDRVGKEYKEKFEETGKHEYFIKDVEIEITDLKILNKAEIPFDLETELNLDVHLDNLPFTLKNPKNQAIFKVQAKIIEKFREYLNKNGFTEFMAPKIVGDDAEGGAGVYEVEYFGNKAGLATSPQLYKQIMVGVLERVFTVGTAFRAEKHSTSRHLNEYTSLDFEMGFIDSYKDVMKMHNGLLKFIVDEVQKEMETELEMFGVEKILAPEEFPVMSLPEAQELLEREFEGVKAVGEPDLEPEHERLLCQYAKEKLGSDFIFITHYPVSKRPFYTYKSKDMEGMTDSFDLLFKGVEITSGGQRIHDYDELVESMKAKGLDPEKFEFYLQAFKTGIPPHGGIGLGVERLTQKILGLDNVKKATLFPREINRIDTLLNK
jgi:nondiscriminating aspartyl-tRNA synthetase